MPMARPATRLADGTWDVTVPLAPDTPPWPGDVPFGCGWSCRREAGASVNLGVFTHSPHVGTHADAPLHVESGWPPSEALPPAVFVGPCRVVALPADHPVTVPLSVATLVPLLGAGAVTRVLLRTGHTVAHGVFPDAWPVLTVEAAEWLVARGMRLWGSDAPSADHRSSQTLPVHHALFAGGAYVLENLALDGVPPGAYELLAAPLLVHGADAAPVRALLRPPTFRA
jgi:arylformamidase